jgi:hypothetical protein
MHVNKLQQAWEKKHSQPDSKIKVSYFMFTEILHFSSGLILFLIFLPIFGIWPSILTFFGAFLIDSDHMFDYMIYLIKTKEGFSLKRFFKCKFFETTGKSYLPLHSWEISAALITGYLITGIPWTLVLGTAMLVHIITDQITNSVKPLAYFLFLRLARGFSKKTISY